MNTQQTSIGPWRPRGRRAAPRVLVAALLAAVAAGCSVAESRAHDAEGEADAPPAAEVAGIPVEVVPAHSEPVAEEIAATGHIEAVYAIEVRPEVDGRILRILVAEGQAVSAGAPLFQIDDAEIRAQVARATAERDLARQDLARTQALLAQNASSPADLERAEAQAWSAEALLEQLSVRHRRFTVRAPFAGVVGQRFVSPGDYVGPQSRLTTLQTVNPQRVAVGVPERYADRLRPGQLLTFRVAALPGKQFTARVEFVDPVVQLPARTILVKALVPDPRGELQPGMFAEARLATAVRESAVTIPEDALVPGVGENAVWVVEDNQAVRRAITPGARRAGWVEVRSGLAAGEHVVVGGLMQLTEGAAVAPRVVHRAGAAAPAAGAVP